MSSGSAIEVGSVWVHLALTDALGAQSGQCEWFSLFAVKHSCLVLAC